jgi:hypothetical protein
MMVVNDCRTFSATTGIGLAERGSDSNANDYGDMVRIPKLMRLRAIPHRHRVPSTVSYGARSRSAISIPDYLVWGVLPSHNTHPRGMLDTDPDHMMIPPMGTCVFPDSCVRDAATSWRSVRNSAVVFMSSCRSIAISSDALAGRFGASIATELVRMFLCWSSQTSAGDPAPSAHADASTSTSTPSM